MFDNAYRIIFDYDGTLLIHHPETECEVISEYLGIPHTETLKKELREFFSGWDDNLCGKVNFANYMAYAIRRLSIINSGMVSYEDYIEAQNYCCIANSKIYEETYDVLEYLLGRGYKLCIATNGFYKWTMQSMQFWKIDKYFENVYTWDNTYAKPDFRFFYNVIQNTLPKNNIMVGDSLRNDIIPAKALGMYTIGLRIKENVANIHINDLKEIVQYF